jgi:Tfp pilus assembly protein PilF
MRRQLDQAVAMLDRILAIDPAFPGARQDRDAMAAERETLRHAAKLASSYARGRGLEADDVVEIASAVVDENGKARFTMTLTTEQIGSRMLVHFIPTPI